MLRILHVTESLAAGGIETTFLNVLRAWRQEPAWAIHDVLAFSGGSLEGAYQQSADAVTVTSLQQELERAVLGAYDLIYFTFERCAYRLLPFTVSHSRAAVVYGKGYDMGGMFRLNDGLEWQADESMMWGADAVTFTTTDLASGFDLGQSFRLKAEATPCRSTVLGKAADVQRFMSLAPPDASTPRRIVCVANLHARKRLGDLLTAVARLQPDFRDVRVRFVGADESGEGARLRDLAASLGIGDACEIVGRRADVAADLERSRVFSLPSGCEGVPTAMLEAMAAARPVVMTNVGHISSVITDGVDGYVVAPGDVDALTARLRTLLAESATAQRMGLAARGRAEAHDVVAVAARLRAVLELASARKVA